VATEARVHFELYRHLQNAIEQGLSSHGVVFKKVECEYNVDGGFADVVVWDSRGKIRLVVEAKREQEGRYRRDIDPYSPDVIKQAFGYAGILGADYFATFNGRTLVLFKTFERGMHLMRRNSRVYRITDLKTFAPHLLREVAALEAGTLRWDPLDRAFVGRLVEFHRLLAEDISGSLQSAEAVFRKKFEKWVAEQGWDIPLAEAERRFAVQAAYLIVNKLVFHKVLQDSEVYRVPPLRLDRGRDLLPQLASAFKGVVQSVDFEAIYEHDPIFDEIPLPPRATESVLDFILELEDYDLSQFDQDVIGRIYEQVIPWKDRLELGQYYTPPEVVELICRLTIKSPEDRVLDPACGSGGFLVGAYNRLRALKDTVGQRYSHETLLEQIFGIDINRFPAHLSAINLALRKLSEKTRKVNIEVLDFFHANPGQQRMIAERAGPGGREELELSIPPRVSVIVANPPYIRQERIADKQLCRSHLARVGATELNEQSDIYCYFFTHSYEFLEARGRLGFITSNLWLAVRYGEALQKWFLEHFKILAVIHPWRRVFEGQLVPTCISILDRSDDPATRDANLVKFIMVKKQLRIDDLVNLVERGYEPWVVHSEQSHRVMAIPQSDLRRHALWHRFLYAPPVYWRLIGHEKLVPLRDIATICRGITTGANEFFILDENTVRDFGIETEFLRPVVKSPRDLDGLTLSVDRVARRLLDLHNFVQEALVSETAVDAATVREVHAAEEEYRTSVRRQVRRLTPEEVKVTASLHHSGREGAYRYVLWGIRRGFYARETCSARRIWFDLGSVRESRLVAPQNIRGRPFFPVLDRPCALINVLYHIEPYRADWVALLAAFLNSSVGKLFFEVHGRIQMGGMIRLIEQDVEQFPILDPRVLTQTERQRIVGAYQTLVRVGLHEDEAWEALLNLDRAVLAPFGLEDRAEEVAQVAKALSEARQEQKEYEIPVEVERVETVIVPGAVRTGSRTQTNLRDFEAGL